MLIRRFTPYYRYLRPMRGAFVAALLLGGVAALTSTAGLGWLIQKVFAPIFDVAPELRPPSEEFIGILLLIPLIVGVRAVALFGNAYLVHYCGTRVLEAIRADFVAKLQRLSLSFLQRHKSGDLLARGIGDAQVLQNTLTLSANELVVQPLSFIGGIGYIAYLAASIPNASWILVGLAVIPLCVFPVRFLGRRLLKRATQTLQASGDVSQCLAENLSAAREVRAFDLGERELDRFNSAVRRLFGLQLKVARYANLYSPVIEFITATGIGLFLFLAYGSAVPGSVIISMVGVLYFCYEPVKKLGRLHAELLKGSAALDRLEEVLLATEDIRDPQVPAAVSRVRGALSFENVSFSYEPERKALDQVTFSLEPGTVCAVVGPTGAGKSSLANLVLRLHDPQEGVVRIDGQDVRNFRLSDLRRNLALFSQDPFLFTDTLENNIRLGRSDASFEEVVAAAELADADGFIRSLPEGYRTKVGERGSTLSGGQRQRIALARAFLRNAPILILDEATSALDAETERRIQAALRVLVQGRTVMIIAHRFSTIRDASKILVLEGGRVAAFGTYSELLTTSPLFARLAASQGMGETPRSDGASFEPPGG